MLVQNNLLVGAMTASAANSDAAWRDQYIEASGTASCSYYTTDLFLGPTAPSVMENHGLWIKQGFDAVALVLKARAEALHLERLVRIMFKEGLSKEAKGLLEVCFDRIKRYGPFSSCQRFHHANWLVYCLVIADFSGRFRWRA